jgi:pilus assembly protein FimV
LPPADFKAGESIELLPFDVGGLDSGNTSHMRHVDFDIGSTGLNPVPAGIDLDVGAADPEATGRFSATQELEANFLMDDSIIQELEPITMSEVGTKLDLARAYMDMGDPDGARNMLREVLQEGAPAQKQEAQRLLDSIPG